MFKNLKMDRSDMLLLALLAVLCLKDGEDTESLLILAAVFLFSSG